jgi:hypothetical protein
MTRSGYLFFNILLVAALFAPIYFLGSERTSLDYVLTYFFAPYIALNLLCAVFAMIRSFMTHNADHAREAVTFLHATWIVLMLVVIASKVNGGAHMQFLHSFHFHLR